MNGRKTILLVDDDAGTLRVLSSGLANTLGMFDVATATNGREAIEVLDARPVDVVVTDLAMPVMDGFALIGHLTNRDATVPVVVLSALAPHDIDVGLNGYHGLTVLTKPAGHEEVASAVLTVLEQVERGQVEGIPLPSVLQLVEAERRTCTLVVISGRRRGRLHFESGRLINAFSDDFGAEGEAAAHDVLSWERTAIEFDRLPDGIRRLIHLPTQAFLVEVARRQDEAMNALAAHAPLPPRVASHHAHPDAWATPSGAEEAAVPAANPPSEDPPMGEDATDPAATGEAATGEAANAEAATGASQLEPATADPAASEPAAATGSDDPVPAEAPEAASAMTTPEAPAAASDGGPGPAPHDPTGDDAPGSSDAAATPARTGAPPLEAPAATPTDAPTHAAAGGPSPTPHAPQSVQDLIAAIARLADRVQVADEALAAVASEVAAFHAAQQRYDAAVAQRDAQREARRRRTAAVRDDVAALAREILAKMDGLFDALTEDEPPDGPPGERSDAPPTGP